MSLKVGKLREALKDLPEDMTVALGHSVGSGHDILADNVFVGMPFPMGEPSLIITSVLFPLDEAHDEEN